MKTKLGWLLFLTSISISNQAGARDLFNLSLEELSTVLITGVTLTKNSLQNVPASVTVFTQQDIEQLPVSTLEELMNYVSGFQSYRSSDIADQNLSSIRGRRTGVTSREMLILINGKKIISSLNGGNDPEYANIPLSNIARVEFIRGPGSAIYGSGAFTGTINIITQESGNQLKVSSGEFETIRLSWQQAAYLDEKKGIRHSTFIDTVFDHGDDYTVDSTFGNGMVNSSDGYRDLHFQTQFWFSKDTRLQLLYRNFKEDEFYIIGTIDDNFSEVTVEYAGLLLEQNIHWHENIDSLLQLEYQRSNSEYFLRPYLPFPIGSISDPPSTAPLLFITNLATQEPGLRWTNDWNLSNSDSLQFGVEYRRPEVTEAAAKNNYDLAQIAEGQIPITYYGGFNHSTEVVELRSQDVFALYVQNQHQWSARLSSIVGLRYDYYSIIGSAFSPRLGLMMHARENDNLKFLLGRAFRSPSLDEIYVKNNPIVKGNLEIEPETVDTLEMIWLHQGDQMQWNITLFKNYFKDSIGQNQVGALRINDNSEKSESSSGFEFELVGLVGSQLKYNFSATKMLDVPDTFFREAEEWFSLAATFNAANWYTTATLIYVGSRENSSEPEGSIEELDSYALLNFKAAWQVTKLVEPYLELRNALNELYYVPAGAGVIAGGLPNRGRELRVGVSLQY